MKYTSHKTAYKDIHGKRKTMVVKTPVAPSKEQHAGVNYVHSLDAYIARSLINKFPHKLITIHDAFGMPIHLVQEFRVEIREVYTKILVHPHINGLPRLRRSSRGGSATRKI